IQRQFHHLVRTVPGGGRIVWNTADMRLKGTLAMGCWTPCEGFAGQPVQGAHWTGRAVGDVEDFSRFEVLEAGRARGTVQWELIGAHNMENALASIATHSPAPWPARTRSGCTRPPTWDGMPPPCSRSWAGAAMGAATWTRSR